MSVWCESSVAASIMKRIARPLPEADAKGVPAPGAPLQDSMKRRPPSG